MNFVAMVCLSVCTQTSFVGLASPYNANALMVENDQMEVRIVWFDITEDHSPMIYFRGSKTPIDSSKVNRDDLVGRYVKIDGEVVTVLGGYDVETFENMLKIARVTRIDDWYRSLVIDGLGARHYATRVLSHIALQKAGEKALPALAFGLRSKDAEVRWRCELLLTDLRLGTKNGRYP